MNVLEASPACQPKRKKARHSRVRHDGKMRIFLAGLNLALPRGPLN
jgi:hypothetical protein